MRAVSTDLHESQCNGNTLECKRGAARECLRSSALHSPPVSFSRIACSVVDLDLALAQHLSDARGEGDEDLVHLARVVGVVVLGALVGPAPEAHAKRQVLEAHLQRLLDAARVELECARVDLNVLEVKLLRRLLHRDDAAVGPHEHWPVARLRASDDRAVLVDLGSAARRQPAQVLVVDAAPRVADVEGALVRQRRLEGHGVVGVGDVWVAVFV